MKLTLKRMSLLDFRRKLAEVVSDSSTVVLIEKMGARKGFYIPFEIARKHLSRELRDALARSEKEEIERIYGLKEAG